jgi:hypothetical protein
MGRHPEESIIAALNAESEAYKKTMSKQREIASVLLNARNLLPEILSKRPRLL